MIDKAGAAHDSLFTVINDKSQVLKLQSLGPLIKKALVSLGIANASAHSLRGMIPELLELVAKNSFRTNSPEIMEIERGETVDSANLLSISNHRPEFRRSALES